MKKQFPRPQAKDQIIYKDKRTRLPCNFFKRQPTKEDKNAVV
jgi:hypothetical protein